MSDDLRSRTAAGPGLTGLVLLAVVVLGVPRVWAELRAGAPGLGSVFFPLLLVAVGSLAVSRSRPR